MVRLSECDKLTSSSIAVLEFPRCFHQTSLCYSLMRTQGLPQTSAECQSWVFSKEFLKRDLWRCLDDWGATWKLAFISSDWKLLTTTSPWFKYKTELEFEANEAMVGVIFYTEYHSVMHDIFHEHYQCSANVWIKDAFNLFSSCFSVGRWYSWWRVDTSRRSRIASTRCCWIMTLSSVVIM